MVFAFLWASAVLFDQGKWDDWASSPASLTLSASAFWLLFRPWSSRTLAVLAAVSIWVALERAPWLSNHWVLATMACLTILIAFARTWHSPRERPHNQRLVEDFGPALRLELLVLYGWAFFNKLNTGYLDPATSCATLFYHEVVGRIPAMSATGWVEQAAIYGSLAVEFAIPVLLVSSSTRRVGLLLACGFHLFLGANGFFNFSAYMFAFLSLFLPQGSISLVLQRAGSSETACRLRARFGRVGITTAYLWTTRALFAIALLVLVSQISLDGGDGPSRLLVFPFEGRRSIISRGIEALWWLWAPMVLAIFVAAIRESSPKWPAASCLLRLPSPLYVVPILLLVFIGASPHLGLKTEHSFTMFSNLRTEGGRPNHLILRNGALWGGYQDDLVAIESSNDRALKRLADEGYYLPWFEFRSHLSRTIREDPDPISVQYVRKGERHTVDARAIAELNRPDHWLARKVLYFRPVPVGDRTPCIH